MRIAMWCRQCIVLQWSEKAFLSCADVGLSTFLRINFNFVAVLFWAKVRSLCCQFLCQTKIFDCQPSCGLSFIFVFVFFSTFVLFFFLCILCCICQKALGSCADVGLSSFLRINFSEEESASVTVISLKENNDVNHKDY